VLVYALVSAETKKAVEWERVWIWRRLELLAYAVDFRRSLRKADPALPILLVICGTGPARSPFSPTEPRERSP
jgi:hypothetical protein